MAGRRSAPGDRPERGRAVRSSQGLGRRHKTAQALAMWGADRCWPVPKGCKANRLSPRSAWDQATVGKRRSWLSRRGGWRGSGTSRARARRGRSKIAYRGGDRRNARRLPEDSATYWSSRRTARAVVLDLDGAGASGGPSRLQPHRLEFKFSTDPDFAAKVRDVVGLDVASGSRRSSCAWTRKHIFRPSTPASQCSRCARPAGAPEP